MPAALMGAQVLSGDALPPVHSELRTTNTVLLRANAETDHSCAHTLTAWVGSAGM